MGLFNSISKSRALMDEIRCDEASYLIWKWHPKGTKQEKAIEKILLDGVHL